MKTQYGIAGRSIANPEIYWNKNLIKYHSFLIIRLTEVILATMAVSACKGQQLGGSFGDQTAIRRSSRVSHAPGGYGSRVFGCGQKSCSF
ncbi:MAG: hypothetical protein J5I94_07475 [Phaeodactylibacter sp.]|nr:hypothetical protein [Phaeodactylibacter sp.]